MKLLIAAAFLVAAAPALAAGNLVGNGSFETGDFTGWTQFGDTGASFVDFAIVDNSTDGIYQASFGPIAVGGIEQTIASTAHHYIVSFDLANDSGAFNSVAFGGLTLLGTVGNQLFTHYNFDVHTSANPTLSFSFQNEAFFYALDNVGVEALVGGVPESATWAMLIAGFGLTGAAMRRRQAALAA
jgi:hypothetical protein